MKKMIQGVEREVRMKMYSLRERDMIEREFNFPSMRYLGGLIELIRTGGNASMPLVEKLIGEQRILQDKLGSTPDIAIVSAIVQIETPEGFRHMTREEVGNLPDDEFRSLNEDVQAFVNHYPDKFALLNGAIADIVKDAKEKEKLLKVAEQIFSGETEIKN